MRDGVELAADVVRPVGAGPLPVLLIRTPYSRGSMRLVHDVVGLARDGWAVVVQDVRGRFDSQGVFNAFVQEVDDGYDTLDWCSRQEWSDGRVAMTGWSYVGATQWLAAQSPHPALLAINPVVGAGDIETTMLYEGGAFQIGLVLPWVLGLAASDPAASQQDRERAGELGARWPELLRSAPASDEVADLLPGYRAWRENPPAEPATVSVPVASFQVAGWYDIFCESALRHWSAQRVTGRPQRLVIGPWSHSNGLSNVHPERDFGAAANGGFAGVLGRALHWLRQVLDGQQVESGISCFVMGDGWREMTDWPPPACDLVLHFGLKTLQEERGTESAEHLLQHDPRDPVPTRGGRVLGPFLPLPGPVDQTPLEQRADVAVYSGRVLTEPLTVIGHVRAQIRVSSTGSSVDLVVTLCDAFPDGRVFNVVGSVRRVVVTPGEPFDVEVSVGSTAYRFAAGHCLRLHVASSSSPRYDINPSTAEPPGTARELRAAVHTIYSEGSTLTLPKEA